MTLRLPRAARPLLATAAALVFGPAGDRAAAQQGAVSARDTALWILPELLEPRRPLLDPPAPEPPFLRLGRARIPATLFPLLFGAVVRRGPGDPPPLLDGTGRERNPRLRFGVLGRTIGYGLVPEPASRGPPRSGAGVARFRNEFADLGFSVRGTGQIGGDWTEFRPCDETVQVTCEVSFIPRIKPDIYFAATADGTIADRIVVDVDYDQTREYVGANRVNISYRGLPGEVFRSFDIGDVSFDLPESQFLREGVPAGNFGFQAALEAGPVEFRSVWAQQAGEVTTRTFRLGGSGESFSRTDTVVLDDADYIEGQFFSSSSTPSTSTTTPTSTFSHSAPPTPTRRPPPANTRFSSTAPRSTPTPSSRSRATSRPTQSRFRVRTPSPNRPGSVTSSPAGTTWFTRAVSGSRSVHRCCKTRCWP